MTGAINRRDLIGFAAGSGAGGLAAAAVGRPLSADGQGGLADGAVPQSIQDKLAETLSIADFGARPDHADNKEPIERAIEAAMARGRTVLIPPGTFSYSRIDLGRNDAAEPVRLVIGGTGTLRSTFAGNSITASTGPFYDLVIDGPRFESRAGAGTTLFDGDRLIRLVIAPGTQIDNFDWVIRGRAYLQSVRMLGAIIRGGSGAVVKAPMAFDCTFAHNIIEFVTDGIVIDGANDPAVHTCRILHNVIEGTGGRAVVLGTCLATSVSGNYLESNQVGDILLNAGSAPHKGLKVQDNSIQLAPPRLAQGAFGIVWGRSTALPVRAGGNFCNGPLHDTEGVTALIDMSGDVSLKQLYRGYQTEAEAGRAPVGRAIYSDGLAQHIAWFDRYLALDPYHNEVRFGGRHRSQIGSQAEPQALTFGIKPPDEEPGAFERKRWARGSIVFNAQAARGRPVGWICVRAGEPGEWMAMPAPL